MGQALLACAARIPELEVVGTIDQGDDLAAIIGKADVVIDFSFHSATLGVAELCAKNKKAIVIGTTGHSAEEKNKIIALKAQIPMVIATNFSTGVNTLFWLTRKAAQILGSAFDLEVVEMHHRLKKDAPSGTATTLLEILSDVQAATRRSVAPRTQRHCWRTHTKRNRYPRHPRRRCRGRPHGDFRQ